MSDSFSTELEVCFEVLLYLASLMQQLPVGEVLTFTSTDPNAQHAVIEWVELRGYELLRIEARADGSTQFQLRRSS